MEDFELLLREQSLLCLKQRLVQEKIKNLLNENFSFIRYKGLFPNAGAAYFLSRLSNNLGVFLGLTGHRLRSSDVVSAGLATHFIPSSNVSNVEQQLIDLTKSYSDSVNEILNRNSQSVCLKDKLPSINRIFSLENNTVEKIFNELKSDGSSFALEQLSILQKKVRLFNSFFLLFLILFLLQSPMSLKLTLEELKRGKQLDFKECLQMEYRILQHRMHDFDFLEGVRTGLLICIEKNSSIYLFI